MGKVSFDFDSTLSKPSVQQYAKGLIQRGFEVWIVTSRFGFGKEPNPQWNDDVFEVAREVGIKKEHIFFTCMANKSEFLKVYTRTCKVDALPEFIFQDTEFAGTLSADFPPHTEAYTQTAFSDRRTAFPDF